MFLNKSIHRPINSDEYYASLNREILNVDNNGLRALLQDIARRIREGTFP